MKKYLVLFVALFSLVSCDSSDDLDTTKPEISIITPTDHQEVLPGQTLHFLANVSDNESLASYKIEVHNSDDGHQHRSLVQSYSTEAFSTEIVGILSGKSQEISHNIQIPSDVLHGHYHVGIFVIDAAGNQNENFVEIYIGDEEHHH